MTREDRRQLHQAKKTSNKKQRERDKQQKIRELKDKANKEYHRATTLLKKSLIAALHCGEALLEIKDLVGHGNWEDWVENNFDDSLRTAEVYMGIAKHWGDPRIVAMREKGIEINSIKAFHEALAGKPDVVGTEKQPVKENIVYERYKKYIIKEFTEQVNRLDGGKHWSRCDKVFLLGDHFHHFWHKLYIELKRVAKAVEKKGIDTAVSEDIYFEITEEKTEEVQ